jgi:energy-coupling factor transport system substrate-specific component
MKMANAQPGGTPGTQAAMRPTPIMIVAGIAFLALFIAWIPLHGWFAQLFNTTGDDSNNIGLSLASIVLWLLVFGVVLVAARWSHTVFEGWQTRDLLLTAVVGAVFGVLFSLWTGVYAAFGAILGPWNDLVGGLWWVPAILIPYIIRKPGAALVGETLAAFVSFLAGSPYGFIGAVIAGIVQGMGAEVVFMLTGWRTYNILTLIAAGIAAATTGFVYLWPIYYVGYTTTALLITYAAYVIGVVLFASIGSKLLGDALLATGVLDRFAIGRDRRAAQPQVDF